MTAKESLNPLNCLVFLVCKICSPSHSSTLYMRVGLVAAICCALRLGRVEGESEYGRKQDLADKKRGCRSIGESKSYVKIGQVGPSLE